MPFTADSRCVRSHDYSKRINFTFSIPILSLGSPGEKTSSPLIRRPGTHFPFSKGPSILCGDNNFACARIDSEAWVSIRSDEEELVRRRVDHDGEGPLVARECARSQTNSAGQLRFRIWTWAPVPRAPCRLITDLIAAQGDWLGLSRRQEQEWRSPCPLPANRQIGAASARKKLVCLGNLSIRIEVINAKGRPAKAA